MSKLHAFTTRKKIGLVSLALLATLLASGALTSSGAVSFSSAQTPTNPLSSSTTFPSAPPTFVGSAGHFLSGPFYAPSAFGGRSGSSGGFGTSGNLPLGNPPTSANNSQNDKPGDTAAAQDPPTVSCMSASSGCDQVSGNSGGTTSNGLALNSVSSFSQFGYDIEPPDQGLCANNQYVMESLNIGVVQIYSASNLQPVSQVVSLDNLMGLPSMPPLGWGSGGDIQCQYDYSNGGHWIITEFVSTTPEPESPFTGCFAGVFDTCREGIAVSVTNNPMGAYNVYFLDPNAVNHDPGAGYLLNDYVKTGTTQDAFMLFYDEFNLNPATLPSGPCPGTYGCAGFNGAQQFAFSKSALERGALAASVTVAYENMGTAPNLNNIPASLYQFGIPAGCNTGPLAGFACWYQVIPAQTPDPTQYDNSNGGTGFMVGSLDFFGLGDNRIAVFDWTGLSNLNGGDLAHSPGFGPGGHNRIMFGGQLLTTGVSYMDEGASCIASANPSNPNCGLGAQKAGPIPLGVLVSGAKSYCPHTCPEGGIATNGDGATQASYANGQVWTAVATQVSQTFSTGSETHLGAAYWAVNTNSRSYSVANDGYVTAAHEDMEFASIAATEGGSALMAFTLSGPDYYPSTAYTWLTTSSSVIHIADLGRSPQDGFLEYQSLGTGAYRPRWGDYSAAIFVPSMGLGEMGSGGRGLGLGQGRVFFATEYIQSPNCNSLNLTPPLGGPSCSNTRTTFANWGSSINYVSTSRQN